MAGAIAREYFANAERSDRGKHGGHNRGHDSDDQGGEAEPAGLPRCGAGSTDALKVSKDLATRGADSVDGLRTSVTTWFNFYNGYDPLFTWWMGMP